MPYKRILTIQDISCVGQCSLTVALPVLSACGHETCVLPSAVLSTHTGGFSAPVKTDLSGSMEAIWRHWQRDGIDFDAIYAGYLGSKSQISIVKDIFENMRADGGITVVDPAMADHGKLYKGFDEDYVQAMKGLCAAADIILPNITEAAMLTGQPYRESCDEGYIHALLHGLKELGAASVVLTGVGFRPDETGSAVMEDGKIAFCFHEKIPQSYHGTGDIFAAALVGAYMQGKTLAEAADIAGSFTAGCIRQTFAAPAHWYGVKFETELGKLMELLK